MEKWTKIARACGFTNAVPLNVPGVQVMSMVRDACATGKCRAYNRNWTCPPFCGTLEECEERLRSHSRGILLQTVGQLEKTIDTRGYARVEKEQTPPCGPLPKRSGRNIPTPCALEPAAAASARPAPVRSPAGSRRRPFPPWKATACL